MSITAAERRWMSTTAERAFNRGTFTKVELTAKQIQAIGSLTFHRISKDHNGPVVSWYETYMEGAIPTTLEVFRIRLEGGKDVYERRDGVTLPAYLTKILEG